MSPVQNRVQCMFAALLAANIGLALPIITGDPVVSVFSVVATAAQTRDAEAPTPPAAGHEQEIKHGRFTAGKALRVDAAAVE